MKAKGLAVGVVAGALLAATSAASASVLFSTGFEAPTYTAGQSVHGVNDWFNGSGTGQSQSVSTNQAFGGSQSLMFDNTSLQSFYSVRRAIPGHDNSAPLSFSVRLYIDGNTQANRLYGMYLVSTATATMGSTRLGLTVGGDGSVRAGTTWANTYTNSGLIATLAPGSYLDRWLEISFLVNPDLTASIRLSGQSGSDVIADYTLPGTVLGLNLGSDYFATTDRAGIGYFDNLIISQVPAPGALALLGLAGLISGRRRRN